MTKLENRLPEVVAGIVLLAADIRAKDAEEARRQEKHRQAKERYEFLKRRIEDEKKEFGRLETAASNWERARRIRCYVEAVEQDAHMRSDYSLELKQWVAWARAKADWLDPLIVVSDPGCARAQTARLLLRVFLDDSFYLLNRAVGRGGALREEIHGRGLERQGNPLVISGKFSQQIGLGGSGLQEDKQSQ